MEGGATFTATAAIRKSASAPSSVNDKVELIVPVRPLLLSYLLVLPLHHLAPPSQPDRHLAPPLQPDRQTMSLAVGLGAWMSNGHA